MATAKDPPGFYCATCKLGFKDIKSWCEHTGNHEDSAEFLHLHVLDRESDKLGYRRLIIHNTTFDIREKLNFGHIPFFCHETKKLKFNCPPTKREEPRQDEQHNNETQTSSNFQNFVNTNKDGNDDVNEQELIAKMIDMMPGVAKYLVSIDQVHTERILDMLLLMQRGCFPHDNICFRLFEDVISWFVSEDVRGVRYSEPVRRFWAVGYRLFHNKFLEFMRGPALKKTRDGGEISYSGQEARINFAVPKSRHLTMNTIIPDSLQPGLLTEMIESYLRLRPDFRNKSYNLMADMKKINASKCGKYGEVDLAGFESKPTKRDRENLLEARLRSIDTCMSLIENTHSLGIAELVKLPETCKQQLYKLLLDIIKIQSECIAAIRVFGKSKSYHLDKLLDRARKQNEKEWRQTSLHYVISLVKSQLLASKELITKGLSDVLRLLQACADMMGVGQSVCPDTTIDLGQQDNYECLDGYDEHDLARLNLNVEDVSRSTKQGSQPWFDLRHAAAATGSTIHDSIGIGTLAKMRALFKHKKCGKPLPEFDDETKERLEHGKKNEINGVSTLVSRFLPSFLPGIKFREVGCYLNKHDNDILLVVSPDGEGVTAEGKTVTMFEIKCPFPKKYGHTVFYKIPKYYATQVLSQMNLVPDGPVDTCYLECWSKSSSTFFEIKNDRNLWAKIEAEITKLSDASPRDIPKKKNDSAKEISCMIDTFLSKNVEFVCEAPSTIAIRCEHESREKDFETIYKSHPARNFQGTELLDLEGILQSVKNNVTTTHELTTPKATNLLVYLITDLDRVRYDENEVMTGVPVFYGFAPTAPKMEVMQALSEYITAELEKRGLDIRTRSYDGQMFRLAVHDTTGNPLSLLHQQKQLYSKVASMKKDEVVDALVSKCPDKSVTEFIGILKAAANETCQVLQSVTPTEVSQHPLNTNIDEFITLFSGIDTRIQQDDIVTKDTDLVTESTDDPTKQTAESVASFNPNADSENADNISDSDARSTFSDIDSEGDEFGFNITYENNDFDDDMFCVEDAQQELNATIIDAAYMEDTELYDIEVDTVDDSVIRTILLQLHSEMAIEEFRQKCCNASSIDRNFTLASLRVIVRVLRIEGYSIAKGLRLKKDYVTQVSSCLGDGSVCAESKRTSKGCKEPLSRDLSRIKKVDLNKMLSTILWPETIKEWFSKGPVPQGIILEPLHKQMYWFTQAEFSELRQKECFTIIDPTHILTNARCHLSKNGYPDLAINRDAWVQVAKQHTTALNLSHVEDIIDPQDGDTAMLFFSEAVETQMRINGDYIEAEFCKLIRQWHAAMDERGHDNRAKHIYETRNFLLEQLAPHLAIFPPATTHIKSIPIVTFMSLLLDCERSIQLFRYVKGGTFNLRALGSAMNETFFSGLRDIDVASQGVIAPDQIPKAMSTACLLMESRLDEERGFYMKTTKRCPVYTVPSFTNVTASFDISESSSQEKSSMIEFREHQAFDDKSHKRRWKNAGVNHPDGPAKGAMSIRTQGSHKRREESLDYDVRAGLNIEHVDINILD